MTSENTDLSALKMLLGTRDELSSLNLTSREQEVFILLLKGMAPKEIAHFLEVSFHTVVFHRSNLYRKMGINSIQELFANYSDVVNSLKSASSI